MTVLINRVTKCLMNNKIEVKTIIALKKNSNLIP